MSKIYLNYSKDLGITPRSLLLIEQYKNYKKLKAKYKKIQHDNS
jgi:hypothetical protein